MPTHLLILSYETVADDGAFRHPYLRPWNLALLGDADPLPRPRFALCTTALPAYACTCGRYLMEVEGAGEEVPPW